MNFASVIQTLAGFAWIVLIGLLVAVLMRSSRNQAARGLTTILLVVLVAAILLTTVGAGLVFLQADEYGVVISAFTPNGYRTEALGPGLHWIVPFVESVRTYSIARETYTMSSTVSEGQVFGDDSIEARTKDGQQVLIEASVIYAVDPTDLINLHIIWQDRYEDMVIRPVSRSAIRDAVSQFGIEEIVSSKRAEMQEKIFESMKAAFGQNSLILSEFLLRDIRFSDEYAAAVEQKQVAERQAQQAAFVVQQRKQEAEQARQVAQGQADAAVIAANGAAQARVIQANAEAQANQVIGQSLRDNPSLIQYLYVQKVSEGVQTIFVPSGNQFILPLPATQP